MWMYLVVYFYLIFEQNICTKYVKRYLLEIVHYPNHQKSPLFTKSPGKLSRARLLTANRVLRFCINTEQPSLEIEIIVEYFVKMCTESLISH